MKCKMRSLFSKSLLGWAVETAPRINLRDGLEGLEGSLVISTPSLTSRLLLSHPRIALFSGLFLKPSREENLNNVIV